MAHDNNTPQRRGQVPFPSPQNILKKSIVLSYYYSISFTLFFGALLLQKYQDTL